MTIKTKQQIRNKIKKHIRNKKLTNQQKHIWNTKTNPTKSITKNKRQISKRITILQTHDPNNIVITLKTRSLAICPEMKPYQKIESDQITHGPRRAQPQHHT